jgi:hypothetical protein
MDTNQSGEIYPKDTVSLESLENWKNTIS